MKCIICGKESWEEEDPGNYSDFDAKEYTTYICENCFETWYMGGDGGVYLRNCEITAEKISLLIKEE